MVSAIARRFSDCGLPAGAVVAIQLPNVVESVCCSPYSERG